MPKSPETTQAESAIRPLAERDPQVTSELAPEAEQGTAAAYEGDAAPGAVFDQAALQRIGVEESRLVALGQGVMVAIVDTGVDYSHPLLGSVVSPFGWDFLREDPYPVDFADGADQDADGLIDEGAGHGTHVAGLVRAVAPLATILPIMDSGA